MAEPTIDEMLKYLEQSIPYSRDIPEYAAIRAILEQFRPVESGHAFDAYIKQCELDAIRAFVERVEMRWKTQSDNPLAYRRMMYDELAAMEKANARTND